MQRLYENHKVLTYPRTDSRYLTTDIVPTLKERLKACAVGPYSKFAGRLSMQKLQASKSFVNDSRVSDHHAIIPTEQFVQLDHMSNEERKIYDLVVRRFLAVLSPACEYEETVSDHHAIIPTEQFVQLDHMSNEERKIYDLVVRRFLAVLSPACEYEETAIRGTIGTEQFHAKGNFMLSAGWRTAGSYEQ